MTPIPPASAKAIAILLSVIVSIAEDIKGIFKVKLFDNFILVLTSEGKTSNISHHCYIVKGKSFFYRIHNHLYMILYKIKVSILNFYK